VKDLQLRDIIAKRLEEMKTAQMGQCLKCPQFVKHVSIPYFLPNFLRSLLTQKLLMPKLDVLQKLEHSDYHSC